MIPTLPNGNPDNRFWHTYRHIIDLNGEVCIQRCHDHAWLPKSETNGDYRNYLNWVANGNVPEVIDYRDPEQAKTAYDNEIEHFKLSEEERTKAAQDAYFAKGVKS